MIPVDLAPQALAALLEAFDLPAVIRDARGEPVHLTQAARLKLGLLPDETLGAAALEARLSAEGLATREVELEGGGRVELVDDAERRRELLRVALHDLRSPVANVRSYASLMAKGRLPPDRLARTAEVLSRNADRALRLIADFLDSELAELGSIALTLKHADLGEVVRTALTTRRPLAAERGVELEVGSALDGLSLEIDAERIQHALESLLDQAVARAPPGSAVQLQLEVSPHEVHVAIVDRGPALEGAALAGAFLRDSCVRRDRRVALGSGLALARAVAVAHGGSLGVASSAEATTWLLTLPRAEFSSHDGAQHAPHG